jgi:hypothetical protein
MCGMEDGLCSQEAGLTSFQAGSWNSAYLSHCCRMRAQGPALLNFPGSLDQRCWIIVVEVFGRRFLLSRCARAGASPPGKLDGSTDSGKDIHKATFGSSFYKPTSKKHSALS